jgi:apolipoprotein N-acyltransferase|tara:strand:- start:42233 stop:43846 length:1614 start_codon:yes stop_codon:yes gene_type:complete
MKNTSKKHRFALSLLSGILMGISFPHTGSLFFLSFVAWVPLLLLENTISEKNYKSRKVFTHAYLAFFLFNLISTWWIYFASAGGAIMAVFANSLLMAGVFYLFHLTKKYVGKKEGYLSLFIFWIAFEYMHFHWELSYPWLNLGNTFARVPWLVQWYSFSGILGGSLWILIMNVLIYRLYLKIRINKLNWRSQIPMMTFAGFVLFIPAIISLAQYFNYSEKKNPMEIVLVQPNIDPYNEKFTSGMEGQIDKITHLADGKITPKTDLVMAPETALSYEFDEDQFKRYPFSAMLDSATSRWGCDLLIGASTVRAFENKNSSASRPFTDGPGFWESYNTSLLLNTEGEAKFLHKSKLVLGVEKIPFISMIPFLEDFSIDQGGASGTLGIEKEPQTLTTKNGVIAPVICYESIYGEFVAQQVRKGAEVIAIITNDGWWSDTPGYKQHMSFARLRAVENRRSVARSANTGTSGFINQRGDIVDASLWWTPLAMRGTINKNRELTVYSQYGDFIGRSFAFVSALLLLLTFVRRFKKKFATSQTA